MQSLKSWRIRERKHEEEENWVCAEGLLHSEGLLHARNPLHPRACSMQGIYYILGVCYKMNTHYVLSILGGANSLFISLAVLKLTL